MSRRETAEAARAAGSERAAPSRRRIGAALAAVALVGGAALTVWLVGRLGWRAVTGSLGALGAGGFAVFCGYTLGVFALLGLSWFVIAPGLALRRLPAFVFGRLLREAAADVLPFSQLGGFVLGARAASLLGAPPVLAIASSIVDLVTEMAGQLLFTGLAAALIATGAPSGYPHRLLDPVLWIGLGAGWAMAAAFYAGQRSGAGVVRRLSARWPAGMRARLAAIQASLRELHRRPARTLASALLHFAAWIAASGGVWLVLAMMGAPLSLRAVIELEALIYLLRSAAFFVPGAVGVLEGGYILLGPVFGLEPQAALSLSLIKRGRDVVLGAPAVLAWQLLEGRRWMSPKPAAPCAFSLDVGLPAPRR